VLNSANALKMYSKWRSYVIITSVPEPSECRLQAPITAYTAGWIRRVPVSSWTSSNLYTNWGTPVQHFQNTWNS